MENKYSVYIESATKEKVWVANAEDQEAAYRLADLTYSTVTKLMGHKYITNVACVKIYYDDIFVEQYGPI